MLTDNFSSHTILREQFSKMIYTKRSEWWWLCVYDRCLVSLVHYFAERFRESLSSNEFPRQIIWWYHEDYSSKFQDHCFLLHSQTFSLDELQNLLSFQNIFFKKDKFILFYISEMVDSIHYLHYLYWTVMSSSVVFSSLRQGSKLNLLEWMSFNFEPIIQ